MQRYIRGLMLAGTAVVAWGCTENPIGDGADEPANLVANPSEIFADAGATVTTLAELQNDQGAALETQFAILNVDAGITAVIDETFNPHYDADGNLVPPTSPTRARILVTAGANPGVYSFDVSAGGMTEEVEVRVLPLTTTGTFSSATPACNTAIDYTVAAPYSFLPSAAAELTPVVGTSVSGDGQTISFITAPGFSGTVPFSGVQLDFLAGVPLDFESAESIDVGTDCFTGQDAFGTAPTVPMPMADGEETTWFDVGNLAVDQWYAFTVPTDGTYDITLDWEGGADVDLILYTGAGALFNTSMATGSHPEHGTIDMPAGDYIIRNNLYAGTAPAWVEVHAIRVVPD